MEIVLHKPIQGNPKKTIQKQMRCPRCDSDALYKYGKTNRGKERFLCQVCNRQFVKDTYRREIWNRPFCPRCGKAMHIFKKEAQYLRFRCSDYPTCKTYAKLERKDM
jgi:transposase-like protein